MKKLISILTLIVILLTIFCGLPAKAAKISNYDRFVTISKDGNWGYIVPFNLKGIVLVDYRGNETEVVVPEMVDEFIVTGVGDFYDEIYEKGIVSKLFSDDDKITKVTLPKTFERFGCYTYEEHGSDWDGWEEDILYCSGYCSFYKNSITDYIVNENNPYFSSENGIIYNKDKTELVIYPAAKTDEVFTLPKSVKEFSPYAFSHSKVKQVKNFDNVTELSNYLFAHSNIEEFPKMENIQEIAPYAFAYCNNLKNVTIPLRVDDVNSHAFYSCKNLKEVDFGKIIYIRSAAFAQCSSLKEANLPRTCGYLGNYAFSNCKKLESINFTGVSTISDYAFNKCKSLKKINSYDYGNTYENELFVETIEYDAFKDCTALENLTISAKVIEKHAFLNCTALKDISYSYNKNLESIHTNAFTNTAYVNNHKDGMVYLGEVALYYKEPKKATTTIKIKDGTKHIAEWCLFKIKGVKTVYLPSSLKVVEDLNLCECKDLKRVYIAGKKTELAEFSCQGGKKYKTKYYVKSKAYKVIENFDKDYYTYTTDWKPSKTKSVKAVGNTKSTAKITWKKQGYVTGYEVYMKTSKNGKWKKVATLKDSDSTSYTKKGLSKNKTYYFRVRAYKTVYDTTYYGAYSATDAAKTKKK